MFFHLWKDDRIIQHITDTYFRKVLWGSADFNEHYTELMTGLNPYLEATRYVRPRMLAAFWYRL